ncbi:MAG: isochorismatase family protein [Myxococcota bacterium]
MNPIKMKVTPKSAVLAIIDFQERMARALPDKVAEKTLKNIMIFLKASQVLEIPVVVTEHYPKGLGPTVEWLRSKLKNCEMIEKIVFSAAEEKRFFQYLLSTERKDVILTGIETHVCIYQTARDLAAAGFNIWVPEDAVASRTKQNWARGLELCKETGAAITSSEAIIFDMLYQAGTPQFKEIAPLFK